MFSKKIENSGYLALISSFSETRNFPTRFCTNKIKSFEISIVCAQARFRQRAVSSEELNCGWRVCIANSVVSAVNEVLVESTALFNCCFQNSTFGLFITYKPEYVKLNIHKQCISTVNFLHIRRFA